MEWWMWAIVWFVVGFLILYVAAWLDGKNGGDWRKDAGVAITLGWILWPITLAYILFVVWNLTPMRFFNWIANKAKENK